MSVFPPNLCESCRKKEIDNCVRGPKEHCDDYKSELQWQFEHYVSEEDRRALRLGRGPSSASTAETKTEVGDEIELR